MTDAVQKLFVKSFIGYLKQQVDGQSLAPDALESLEVAVQCLQAAFEIGDDDEAPPVAGTSDFNAPVAENDVDLFDLFQSVYIERNPKSFEMAEQIKNEGNRLMKEGKYNEALIQYNRALTFDPKNPIFYCNRAAACIRLGENDRAVRDCKSALIYNPTYGKAYGRMGIAYSNLGKFDDAQAAYTKAIELEPDNQDYKTNLEVAKNHRSSSAIPALNNLAPQLSEAISTVLANPAYRDLLADFNLQRNDPRIMNVFESLRGGADGGIDADGLVNLFQTVASGFANMDPNQHGGNDPSRQPPQP